MIKLYILQSLLISLFGLLGFTVVQAENISRCIHVHTQSQHIHVAQINLNCPNIEIITTKENDKGMTVSQFSQKYQTDIAINGSYFRKDYLPFGLAVTDHKIWLKTRDVQKRVFLACTRNNYCMIERKNTVSKVDPSWAIAISGWQSFNPDTRKFECSDDDNIGCTHIKFVTKQPRTMVGINQQHNLLYLVVVDGRLPTFQGMTLDELAKLAIDLGITQAINLDGGGSSTMVFYGNRISTLSNISQKERVVANHLGIKYTRNNQR